MSEFPVGAGLAGSAVAVSLVEGVAFGAARRSTLRGLAGVRFTLGAGVRFALAPADAVGFAVARFFVFVLGWVVLVAVGRALPFEPAALRVFAADWRDLAVAFFAAVFAGLGATSFLLARSSCFHSLRAVAACLRVRRASRLASFKRLQIGRAHV